MFVRSWNWFHENTAGRALFLRWFHGGGLSAEGINVALRHLTAFEPADRVSMVRSVAESPRFGSTEEGISVFNAIGRQLGAWCFWWSSDVSRVLLRAWCAATSRPAALGQRRFWRTLLDGCSWSLQHALGEAEKVDLDPALIEAAIERYVELATLVWSAWPAPQDGDRNAIAWALLSPLERDFGGPVRDWGKQLRPILLTILRSAGHADVSAALLGIQWARLDRQTLIEVAEVLIYRLRTESNADISFDLVPALEAVGVLRALPLAMAFRAQDCLEFIGQTFPRATVAANRVESRIRSEQS